MLNSSEAVRGREEHAEIIVLASTSSRAPNTLDAVRWRCDVCASSFSEPESESEELRSIVS
eukprot:scaffold1135_cov53-Phaeocystis_antarctica.AAC.7